MTSLVIHREYFPDRANAVFRESLIALRELMLNSDDSIEPRTEHEFAEGTYTRIMYLLAGQAIVGKVHRRACMNILLQGRIIVSSDELAPTDVEAPNWFVSGAGVAKAIYAVDDCIFMNVIPNPTNTRDVGLLEDWWTHEDYDTRNLVYTRLTSGDC